MKLHTFPSVQLVPVGPIATATEVEIIRGQFSTVRSIDVILPSKNKQDLPEDVMRREFIVRAWLSGTVGEGGGRPVLPQNPLMRNNVNAGNPGAGIFGGLGRVFMGTPRQLADGSYAFSWGPSDTNTPQEIIIPQAELDFPNAEDPLESCIPLIAANLAARDGQTRCTPDAPNVKVIEATRLYQKIIDLVAGYDFPYISY